MRNRYAGPCDDCGGFVPVGGGYFEKVMGTRNGWVVRHVLCVAIAKLDRGVPFDQLSHAQQRAMKPYLEEATMK